MLSSIGRASLRRVFTRGPQSTNRAAQGLWQFQRADNPENANNASNRSQSNTTTRRSYATSTKVISKPKVSKSAASKRAVKTPAKNVKKKVVAKKPVKKPAKKLVKKPVVKARKPVAKPAERVKKPKSEAQLAQAEASKKAAKLKALKAAALQLPKAKTATPYLLFSNDLIRTYDQGVPVVERTKAAGNKWKSIRPEELEAYNHQANQNKAENAAAYKKWVDSHTPQEIRTANLARQALRRLSKKSTPADIKDGRLPKRCVGAHVIFNSDRWASGDFKGMTAAEAVKIMSKEWKELPPTEQQAYKVRAAANRQEYIENYRAVYKRDPHMIEKAKETLLGT